MICVLASNAGFAGQRVLLLRLEQIHLDYSLNSGLLGTSLRLPRKSIQAAFIL